MTGFRGAEALLPGVRRWAWCLVWGGAGRQYYIKGANVFPLVAPFCCELHFTPDHIAWIEEIAGSPDWTV